MPKAKRRPTKATKQTAAIVKSSQPSTPAAKPPSLEDALKLFSTYLKPLHPSKSLKQRLPAKSVARAKSVFKNFSLSKFAKDSRPANFVPAKKDPQVVHAAQRKIISQNLDELPDEVPTGGGMTIALTEASIKKLLPSFDRKSGNVDLDDVMKLIASKISGTQFYSNGNATLNRIALQSQAQEIIASIKQGAKK